MQTGKDNGPNRELQRELRKLRKEHRELTRKYMDLLQDLRYQYHTSFLITQRWSWDQQDTDQLVTQFWCKN